MDIFRIISVGIITVICSVLLKQIKPELTIFVAISGSIIMILLIINSISGVFGEYIKLIEKTGLNATVFSCVVKIIGIGYLVEFAGDICTDAGVPSIAGKILLAGKILILVMTLPIIRNLVDVVLKLMP